MRQIEFYTDPRTGEAMYKVAGESICRELTQQDYEIIGFLLNESAEFYPDQARALAKEYAKSAANPRYYDFLRARRIVNCCFGENERQLDVDEFGNIHFEHVRCPLAAECKWRDTICNPTYSDAMSDREREVMKLYFNQIGTEDIADKLCISIHTVNNHRKNALRRLKLHSLQDFIGYAHRNKIFESQL